MTRQIYALLPSNDGDEITIALEQGRNWLIVPASEFRAASDDKVIAFAPATCVTRHQAAISARTEKEALLSAPYLIEDELAQPVEGLHIALGRRAAGPRDIYVVNAGTIEGWIRQLNEAGLKGARIVPELALLPAGPIIVNLGDRYLVASGERRYGIDLSLPDDLVRALAAPDDAPIPVEPLETHPLMKLVEMMPDEPPADLRQGRFALRAPGFNFDLQSLRAPMALAAACLVVWVGMIAAETSALERSARSLQAEASRQYAGLFPDEGNVTDPAQQIRSKIAGLDQSALEFRPAAAALYEAVLAIEGTEVRAIRYERSNGSLRATLSYGAYGDDAKMRQLLVDAGLQVEIGDSRQEQGRVIGDLTLEPSA